MEKSLFILIILVPIVSMLLMCNDKYSYPSSQNGFQMFLQDYEKKVEPLLTRQNLAQWNAYITGKDEYFTAATQLSLEIDKIHQNEHEYNYLRELKETSMIKDPLLIRQLDLLLPSYISKQINPDLNKEITELSSRIEKIYANFRTEVSGKKYSDNEVTEFLQHEKNQEFRESVWRAQKRLGNEVAPDLIKLAHLRNQSAKELGYQNYYYMAMEMSELDPDVVENVFEELYSLTQHSFDQVHADIEANFANKYGINKSEIRPWHYEDLFAQSAPSIFSTNLDSYYNTIDIPKTAASFFLSIQLPVDSILARSDLYERAGKSQHAFSFFIDRKKDIRILCNIRPNKRWMETMLHELGHAVYDKYLDSELPLLLRLPAHQFTTEGIAMFFGSYSSNANWMKEALQLSNEQINEIETITRANLRLSKLIFARWSLVILNFEKKFYENPDQDLNTQWWDLVEKFQNIKRPDKPVGNEWATKLHVATYPVYYQNYQLGELFASQILSFIGSRFYPNIKLDEVLIWHNEDIGNYLKMKIFKPGKKIPWNDLIKEATGETLSARAFVNQYVSRP